MARVRIPIGEARGERFSPLNVLILVACAVIAFALSFPELGGLR